MLTPSAFIAWICATTWLRVCPRFVGCSAAHIVLAGSVVKLWRLIERMTRSLLAWAVAISPVSAAEFQVSHEEPLRMIVPSQSMVRPKEAMVVSRLNDHPG